MNLSNIFKTDELNKKEVVFGFSKDVKDMPLQTASGLIQSDMIGINWSLSLKILLAYTLLWGILLYFSYDEKIYRSVLFGYFFGAIYYVIGEMIYSSPYWKFQDKTDKKVISFYSKSPYRIVTEDRYNIYPKDKGFIVDRSQFEQDIKDGKIKAEFYSDYSKTHDVAERFKDSISLKGGYSVGVDAAVKLTIITLSIGILVSSRSLKNFKYILPWIIYAIIFSIIQESVWLWNPFMILTRTELWIKNLLLLIGYSLSVTVISIVLHN